MHWSASFYENFEQQPLSLGHAFSPFTHVQFPPLNCFSSRATTLSYRP